jgi:hypothetical protein
LGEEDTRCKQNFEGFWEKGTQDPDRILRGYGRREHKIKTDFSLSGWRFSLTVKIQSDFRVVWKDRDGKHGKKGHL